jgi:cephalosporin hydroxylase
MTTDEYFASLTDKVFHGYLPMYRQIRGKVLGTCGPGAICELGVQKGGSLEMWCTLFPGVTIVGVDNNSESIWPEGTIKVVSEQDDPYLVDTLKHIPHGYMLIVDDASHIASKTQKSLTNLWPLVLPGGFYCIEDWHVGLPSQRALGFGDETLKFAQSLLLTLDQPTTVESIYFQHGLIVIQKKF